MDLKIGLVLVTLLGFCVGVPAPSFSDKVESFFKNFVDKGWNPNCIQTANNKKNQFLNRQGFSDDRLSAIAIVNLYTQDCQIGLIRFYAELNRQMRSGNPKGLWKTAGDLLNKALDLLGPRNYTVLYRGCTHKVQSLNPGDLFQFKQFVSTSRSALTAGSFGCGGTLYILHNVTGVDVREYSYYIHEDETLLKSTLNFIVLQDILDDQEIRKTKSRLNIGGPLRRVIVLVMGIDTDKTIFGASSEATTIMGDTPVLPMIGTVVFSYILIAVMVW